MFTQKLTKGNRILRYGCRTFDTFWVPDDIESCNFQNLLIFGFHETSQNLMSFRQLLFSLFHGGDQRKKSENPRKVSNVRHPYLRILFPFIMFEACEAFVWCLKDHFYAIYGHLKKKRKKSQKISKWHFWTFFDCNGFHAFRHC